VRTRQKRKLAAFASVALAAFATSCMSPPPPALQSQMSAQAVAQTVAPTTQNLIGTWILDRKNSSISKGLGVGDDQNNPPNGILMFDGTNFSFILMGSDNGTYNTYNRPNPPASAAVIDRRHGTSDHAAGIIAYWGSKYSVSTTADGNGFYTLTLPLTDHSYRDFLVIDGGNPQLRLIQFAPSSATLPPTLIFENTRSSTHAQSHLVFNRQ
jgi:hypothetical protein